jgi:hypothetical protein
MRCPKCQFDHELQTTECLKCGIVFSRYQAAIELAAQQPAVAVPSMPQTVTAGLSAKEVRTAREDARRELKCRILALPLALLAARVAAGSGFSVVSGMLTMVLHESGHAITAWLTGTWAIPMLWVTEHGENRSLGIVLLLTSAIFFAGYIAWRMQRRGWVWAAGAVLALQLMIACQPAFTRGALIVFGGDGGAMILATILMATFYAPRESKLYQSWGLRWGLLVIGALSFMYVFHSWSGPYENIPFGEIEGVGYSDPSLLTETYGWSVTQLVDRYLHLAMFCLGVLLIVYIGGLVSACLELRPAARSEKRAAY